MRTWSQRRWLAAAAGTAGAALLFGLPTAIIPNPIFGRQIEAPSWSYLAFAVTAVLSGLLLATYVREPASVGVGGSTNDGDEPQVSDEDAKRFTVGGLLAFFAIGCPTCNKLILLALGTSGAITWFEPVQPLLALAGIGVLVWALRRRLKNELSCDVPALRG